MATAAMNSGGDIVPGAATGRTAAEGAEPDEKASGSNIAKLMGGEGPIVVALETAIPRCDGAAKAESGILDGNESLQPSTGHG